MQDWAKELVTGAVDLGAHFLTAILVLEDDCNILDMVQEFWASACAREQIVQKRPILLATAYSATSTGMDSLRSLRSVQSELASFHSTNSCHPMVVCTAF